MTSKANNLTLVAVDVDGEELDDAIGDFRGGGRGLRVGQGGKGPGEDGPKGGETRMAGGIWRRAFRESKSPLSYGLKVRNWKIIKMFNIKLVKLESQGSNKLPYNKFRQFRGCTSS